MVTINDVAKAAGLSHMTVSRVINGDKRVRDETKARVEEVIDQLGYIPSPSARALASSNSLRILLIYTSASKSYLSALLIGALEEAGRAGHQVLVEKFDEAQFGSDLEAFIKNALKQAHALILPSPLADDMAIRRLVAAHNWPVCFLSAFSAGTDANRVCIDEKAAALDMMHCLIENGHKRVGFITGAKNHYSSLARLAGYEAALEEAGIVLDEQLVVEGDYTFDGGLPAAEKLLDLDDPPTAIFASNDDMAAAVLSVASRRGIRVPDTLSVAGFDDTPIASSVYPRLATIKQPLDQLAVDAVRQVVDMVAKKGTDAGAKKKNTILGHELIRGESIAVPEQVTTV